MNKKQFKLVHDETKHFRKVPVTNKFDLKMKPLVKTLKSYMFDLL